MQPTFFELQNSATRKAVRFSERNDLGVVRARVKQALVLELSDCFAVKAKKMRLAARRGGNDVWVVGSPGSRSVVVPMAGEDEDVQKTKKIMQNPPSQIPNAQEIQTGNNPPSRLPVLVQRPHQMRSKPKHSSNIGKRSHPRPLARPGYTWNMGGRLKEIRIRHLARKFVHIWMSAVFGRVSPVVIRKHYTRRLLTYAFNEWTDLWWKNRKEWKLQIRADYHRRYCICQRVWHAWQEYVILRKIKDAKKAVAITHANGVIQSKVLSVWKVFTTRRRIKTVIGHQASSHMKLTCLGKTWLRWMAKTQEAFDKHEVENGALRYWAHNLEQKAWQTWKEALHSRFEMHYKEQHAVRLYEKSLVSRCFYQGWKDYVVDRRERQRKNVQATQIYINHLVVCSWRQWYSHWCIARLMTEQHERMNANAKRSKMMRHFIHWRYFVSLQDQKKKKDQQAAQHYRHQLLRLILSSLRFSVSRQRLQEKRKKRAEELRNRTLLFRGLRTWLHRCEEKEEISLFILSRSARNMFRQRVQRKVFIVWKQYISWRRRRKMLNELADVHYRSYLVPNCFSSLRVYTQRQLLQRDSCAKAVTFQRECVLGYYFVRWCHILQTTQDLHMMEKMAILQHESTLRIRVLKKWTQQAQSKQKMKDKMAIAVKHYKESLCFSVMTTWMEYTKDCALSRGNIQRAVYHNYSRKLYSVWDAWTKYIVQCHRKQRAVIRADNHHKLFLYTWMFTAWKHYQQRAKNIDHEVTRRKLVKDQERLRRLVRMWQWIAHKQKNERRQNQLVDKHCSQLVKSKVFAAWHQFSILHNHKTRTKLQELCKIRDRLNRVKLRRVFARWQTLYAHSMILQQKNHKASAYYWRRLLQTAFSGWRMFQQQQLRIQVMARQCAWLHNTRLVAKYFITWRLLFQKSQEDHTKSIMALWQWSLILQHRVLDAWLVYTADRQCKKQRIAWALEQRRRELLREGVTEWTRVGSHLADQRSRMAAQHQAQSAHQIFQVVRRCAAHWRLLTQHRRSKRKDVHHQVTAMAIHQRQSPAYNQTCLSTQSTPLMDAASLEERPSEMPELSNVVPAIVSVSSTQLRDGFHRVMVDADMPVRSRPQPRRPVFLMESLKKDGLWPNQTDVIPAEAVYPQEPETLQQDKFQAHDKPPVCQPVSMYGSSLSSMSLFQGVNPKQQNGEDVVKLASNDDARTRAPTPNTGLTGSSGHREETQVFPNDIQTVNEELVSYSQHGENVTKPEHLTAKNEIEKEVKGKNFDRQSVRVERCAITPNASEVIGASQYEEEPLYTLAPQKHVLLPPSAFVITKRKVAPSELPAGETPFPRHYGIIPGDTLPTDKTGRNPVIPESNKEVQINGERMNEREVRNKDDDNVEEAKDKLEDVYNQIAEIHDKLKDYQKMKDRLRTLKVHHYQLHSWLTDYQGIDSYDLHDVKEELVQIDQEIAALSKLLADGKPVIGNLVARAGDLMTPIIKE